MICIAFLQGTPLVTCFVHVLANKLINQSTPLTNRRLLNWSVVLTNNSNMGQKLHRNGLNYPLLTEFRV